MSVPERIPDWCPQCQSKGYVTLNGYWVRWARKVRCRNEYHCKMCGYVHREPAEKEKP